MRDAASKPDGLPSTGKSQPFTTNLVDNTENFG
jgi:hypothetical protein